jgi:hypothetical protein
VGRDEVGLGLRGDGIMSEPAGSSRSEHSTKQTGIAKSLLMIYILLKSENLIALD